MVLRTERGAGPVASVVLAAALVLLSYSIASAQSLTASANPSTGAAGVNMSYVTGSGFPAGAISGAKVAFGTTCAAPAIAVAPVIQVTAIGPLRRFQFLIPASLAPGTYKAWVLGTAGTTAFNTLTNRSCSTLTATASVQGTASLGAAIGGAAVTLVDSQGTSVSGTTASDGTFALPTGGLVPPFLVKVVTTDASGSFPAGTTLYSVSADANASTRINVSTLTDLILRSFYAAESINPDNAFASPTGANAPPSPVAVQSIASLVIPGLALWLDAAGVAATGGAPTPDAINLISSPLIAYQPGVTPPEGLDAVLHQITSETLNPNGSVAQMTIVGGTITETITPAFSGNLVTMNTATVDSVTGNGTGGSFSGLALTPAQQSVVDGINAALTTFRTVINTKGAALTAADLLPLYAPDYLQNGANAQQAAAQDANELAGITFDTAQVVGLLSINGNFAKATVFFQIHQGAESDSGTDTVDFENIGGTWFQSGNQQVAEVSTNVEARRGQPGGFTPAAYAVAHTQAPAGIVTGSTVTGPTNNPAALIWNGLASRVQPKGAQEFHDGVLMDEFFLFSQPLGTTFSQVNSQVPAGSTFTMALTTTTVGNVQYTVQSKAITTETIFFCNLTNNVACGASPALPAHVALVNVLSHTVNFTFTLPKTYSPGDNVFLTAQLFNGPGPGAPNIGCNIDPNGPLNLNWQTYTGTGSITFPANMLGCSNLNQAVQFINVFIGADGPNGESSITNLSLPY